MIAAVRVAFGLIWAVVAIRAWAPTFIHTSFLATLKQARLGQPAAVRSWIDTWLDILQAHLTLFASLLALAASLLALCLILGAFTNAICLLGGLLTLLIWTTAQGFGGPYVAGGTNIGSSIIYVLVFAVLGVCAAGSPWGLDAWLRPRLGPLWWLSSRTTTDRP